MFNAIHVSNSKPRFSDQTHLSVFDKILLLPPAFLLIIWPFFVHSQRVLTNLANESWYPAMAATYDYFMKTRGIAFLITAAAMIVLLITACIRNRRSLRIHPLLILALLFFVMVLLSACFSSYKIFSFNGMVESFETVWIIGGYVIVFYYGYFLSRNHSLLPGLFICAAAGSFLQNLIGLSQILHHDFWSSKIGMWFIFLGQEQKGNIRFRFTSHDPVQAYLSFYNPNYAALYVILMIPLMLIGISVCRQLWQKVFCSLNLLLLFISLYGTRSKVSLGVLAVLTILFILMHIRSRKVKYILAASLLVIACSCCALVVHNSGDNSVLPTKVSKQIRKVFRKQKHYLLSDISCTEDGISYVYKNKTYSFGTVQTEKGIQCYARDQKGNPIRLIKNADNTYCTEKNKLKNIRLSAYKKNGNQYITLACNTCSWTFIKRAEDSRYYYINTFNRIDEIIPAAAAFDDGFDRWFTSRVYTWRRTLPLLTSTLLLGTGPDTFAVVFPQKDYVIRGQVSETLLSEILTRPHSFYLQTALQDGVAALLIVLLIFATVVRKLHSVRKAEIQRHSNQDALVFSASSVSSAAAVCAGLELSLIGFLLMGLLNDSILPIMPYVWGILGISLGYTTYDNTKSKI